MTGAHPNVLHHTADALRASPLLRLVAMAGLTLLLLLPIEWISSLVTERTMRQGEAVKDVAEKWGGSQMLNGPFLSVPYERRWMVVQNEQSMEKRVLTIMPTRSQVRARAETEERARGIFSVPVYRLTIEVNGSFDAPDLAALDIDPELVDWKSAVLTVGLCDTRMIQSRGVQWNGRDLTFQPGAGLSHLGSGIHARVADPFADPSPTFSLKLSANGSNALHFRPVGRELTVAVASNWQSPSFQGDWLPVRHTIDARGFEAAWEIPFLGRNEPAAWTSLASKLQREGKTTSFGVDLITPVDAYRMSERSVKYARLFIVLTFATIWLIEVLSGMRVHPIQYLMVGCALCTFYLLELSLAEQIGFASAYALASVAVALLIAVYATAVLHGRQRAAVVTGTIVSLYGYLYVVLTNEDYALLLGSLILFGALAVIMLATRRIDWYGQASPLDPQPQSGQPA